MNAANIPRFSEGPDLHFAGETFAVCPKCDGLIGVTGCFGCNCDEISRVQDSAGESKVGTLGNTGGAGANSPAPLCPCGQPADLDGRGRPIHSFGAAAYCLDCFEEILDERKPQ